MNTFDHVGFHAFQRMLDFVSTLNFDAGGCERNELWRFTSHPLLWVWPGRSIAIGGIVVYRYSPVRFVSDDGRLLAFPTITDAGDVPSSDEAFDAYPPLEAHVAIDSVFKFMEAWFAFMFWQSYPTWPLIGVCGDDIFHVIGVLPIQNRIEAVVGGGSDITLFTSVNERQLVIRYASFGQVPIVRVWQLQRPIQNMVWREISSTSMSEIDPQGLERVFDIRALGRVR